MSSDWHKDYEDSRKADGIILLGYGDYVAYQSRLEQLVSQGTHFVRWGAVQAGQPGLSVGCDNFRGGYDAARHLLGLGRRRIAFLGDASNHYPEFLERYRGCIEAITAAGVAIPTPSLQVDAISTEQSGYDAANELLARDASVRCDRRGQRPDRDRRDARAAGAQHRRARRRCRSLASTIFPRRASRIRR